MSAIAAPTGVSASRPELVLMVGAGVSMAAPSNLPGWPQLAASVAKVLSARLETATERPGWLEAAMSRLIARRDEGRLPPEYQAQVIEEMAGQRYFEGLQSLDVDLGNSNHAAIAELVEMGMVLVDALPSSAPHAALPLPSTCAGGPGAGGRASTSAQAA